MMLRARLVTLVLLMWLGWTAAAAADVNCEGDTLVDLPSQLGDTIRFQLDTVNTTSYWKDRVFRHGWNINDTTIVYPKFNHDTCIGCGRCYTSCMDGGHQALEFDFKTRQPKLNGSKCVGCHLCRLVCPTRSIGMSKRVKKKN